MQAGQLELNVMMPVMIDAILDSMKMLIEYLPVFTKRCVAGIQPHHKKIEDHLKKNPSLVTVLSPKIGYDKATEIAKEAIQKDISIQDLLLEKGLLSKKEIDKLFAAKNLLPLLNRSNSK